MNLYIIYVLDMASLSQQKSFEVHFAVLSVAVCSIKLLNSISLYRSRFYNSSAEGHLVYFKFEVNNDKVAKGHLCADIMWKCAFVSLSPKCNCQAIAILYLCV